MGIIPQFLEGAAFGVLNDILSEYRTDEGHALPNRYEVLIHPPIPSPAGNSQNPHAGDLLKVSGKEKAAISMRCESVTLPGRGLATVDDANVHGPRRTVVNNVTFVDSLNFVFQASSDLKERALFEKWQYLAFNEKTWNIGYYNDYIGSVEIYLLDKNGQRRYGLKLMECFPKEIGGTDLTYEPATSIVKLSVTMNFRYWLSLDITQSKPSLSDKIGQTLTNTIERNISRNIPAVFRLF